MKRKKSFKHSSNLRNEDAIKRLRIKLGPAGYGIYLMLVEEIYQCGKALDPTRLDILAYELHCSPEEVTAVVKDFGLFVLTADGYVTPEMLPAEEQEAKEPIDHLFAAMTLDQQFASITESDEAMQALAAQTPGGPPLVRDTIRTLRERHSSDGTKFPNPRALCAAILALCG